MTILFIALALLYNIFTLNGNPSFQFNAAVTNAMRSEDKCIAEFGTHAASIDSRLQFENAYDLCVQLRDDSGDTEGAHAICCLGGNDLNSEGNWVWSDGSDNTLLADTQSHWNDGGLWANMPNNQPGEDYACLTVGRGAEFKGIHDCYPHTDCYAICNPPTTDTQTTGTPTTCTQMTVTQMINPAGSPYTKVCDNAAECWGATINCPASAECTVLCTADYSCFAATIIWPTTDGLGHLECDGEFACYGVAFPIPDPNTPLNITCNNAVQCYQATINCPANAECTVSCTGDYSCAHATINWPTSVECDGINDCYDATINCPAGAECSVSCIGHQSCYQATIHWPTTDGLGHLACDGEGACDGVTFPTPDLNTSLKIACDNDYECAHATINCPDNAECYVSCTAEYSCDHATIIWPATDGLGHLACDGEGACSFVTFPIPDPNTPLNIACDNHNQCFESTIYCPTSAECTVSCIGYYACNGATIHWPTIDGLGHLVCRIRYSCGGGVKKLAEATDGVSVSGWH